jgi:hypothetical protein
LEYLIALLLGIFGSLIAWEISLHYRTWCKAIIRSATRRLPDEQRVIREEEWLAGLSDCVGLVSSFSHAAGCWIGAPAVAASAKKAVPAVKDRQSTSTIRVEISFEKVRVRLLGEMIQSMATKSARAFSDSLDDIIQISSRTGANAASAMARAIRDMIEYLRSWS